MISVQVTHRTWDAILHAIKEAHKDERQCAVRLQCHETNQKTQKKAMGILRGSIFTFFVLLFYKSRLQPYGPIAIMIMYHLAMMELPSALTGGMHFHAD